MLSTILICHEMETLPMKHALASLTLAVFSGATAAFIGRQLRAPYLAQLDKEHSLTITVRELDQLNRVKSELVSRLSHEMRTPLNGITGLLSLIDRDDPPEARCQMAAKALQLAGDSATLLDQSSTRPCRVAGLELALARRLARLIDGNVLFECARKGHDLYAVVPGTPDLSRPGHRIPKGARFAPLRDASS